MRAFKRLGLWLTEAAIAGVPMIPLFIYVTSFFEHEGSLIYVMPFVLFYSFNKTATFMLGVFGDAKNPYRIAQVAAVNVIVGATLSLFGEVSFVFSDLGSTFVGLGTGVFGSMYRAVKDYLRSRKRFPKGRPELVGFALMTVFVSLILLARGRLEETIIACYVALSCVALATLRSLDVPDELKTRPLFDYATHDLKKGIPALAFLALVLFVRLYKQTANVNDILLVLVISTAVTVVAVVRRRYRVHQVFEYHGVFYSEMMIFLCLWDVFYFISKGDFSMVIGSTLAMFIGLFLAQAFGKRILGRFHGIRESNVLVCLTMATAVIFLVPALNLPALGFIGFFTQLGHQRVAGLYREQTDYGLVDIYLSNQKMLNIGIVAGQAILVGALAVVSLVMLKNSTAAMYSYAFHIPEASLTGVFDMTRLICDVIFLAQGVILLALEKRKWGSVFREVPAS